ncbi:MAG: radical SAM protein, partial [Syntrophorhabdales bacterium]
SSRGCPFHCEFCSERFYLGQGYRQRPVGDVVEEIKQTGAKHIFFADSNFGGKPAHTIALMEALIPLRIRWSGLFPAYLCNNVKFMDLAKRSGLLHVNIGIESIDQTTLAGLGKKSNNVRHYREILRNLREREISYSLNFILAGTVKLRMSFRPPWHSSERRKYLRPISIY